MKVFFYTIPWMRTFRYLWLYTMEFNFCNISRENYVRVLSFFSSSCSFLSLVSSGSLSYSICGTAIWNTLSTLSPLKYGCSFNFLYVSYYVFPDPNRSSGFFLSSLLMRSIASEEIYLFLGNSISHRLIF